jgi:hypothetical protein
VPQLLSVHAVQPDINGALEGKFEQAFLKRSRSGPHGSAAWNGGFMGSMKKMMLGAAIAVGTVAMTAAPAQAAVRFGVAIGGPAVAYVPPCPGPGYAWVNGYWAQGAWVPGYWNYGGVGPRVGVGVRFGGPVNRFDRGPYYRGDNHFDRGHYDRFRR